MPLQKDNLTHKRNSFQKLGMGDKLINFGLGSSSTLLPPGSTATGLADARGLLYYSPYYF
jgi:hypothetical protein